MKNYDAIIVGAGFSGLTKAIALSKFCEKILILEPCPEPLYRSISKKDSRTTALSYNSKKFYEKLGIWQIIEPKCGAINDIKILDAGHNHIDSLFKLSFSSEDVSGKTMGYIIENKDLKSALLNKTKEEDNIDIIYDSALSGIFNNDTGVGVSTDKDERYSASILIAADGKASKVRGFLSIKTFTKDYKQSAITFNINHTESHDRTAIERFMPTGPFAVLPMADLNKSSIVWTVGREAANLYMNFDEKGFLSEVQNRLGDHLGDIKLVSNRLSFPLSLKYCKQYCSSGCILIGDAAHGIHPIAGQGFNQAVKDIQSLSVLLEERKKLGLSLYSDHVFKSYQSSAFADNLKMIMATDFFNELFSNNNPILRIGRRLGISAVDKTPKIKSFFIKTAMGAN